MTPEEPVEFVRTVCLGHHLELLPEELRGPYTEAVVAECGTPGGAGLRAPEHQRRRAWPEV